MDCFGLLLVSSARYLLEVSTHVSLRVVTNRVFREKQSSKICKLSCKAKTEECDRCKLCFSENFGTFIPFSTTYFLEVSEHISLKRATNGFLRDKNLKKSRFWSYYFKAKTKKFNQSNLCFCDFFWNVCTLFSYIFSESQFMYFIKSSHQLSF